MQGKHFHMCFWLPFEGKLRLKPDRGQLTPRNQMLVRGKSGATRLDSLLLSPTCTHTLAMSVQADPIQGLPLTCCAWSVDVGSKCKGWVQLYQGHARPCYQRDYLAGSARQPCKVTHLPTHYRVTAVACISAVPPHYGMVYVWGKGHRGQR